MCRVLKILRFGSPALYAGLCWPCSVDRALPALHYTQVCTAHALYAQLVSTISPPPKDFTQVLPLSTNYGDDFQDREYCSRTSRLQSCVVSLRNIGEKLPVQREVNNIHDDFAVAVLKNGNTVGHVPWEISRVCWYFLHTSGSEMTCIVNGDRRRSKVDGKGLVVPCVYVFRGKPKHLDRLINPFAKLAA